MTPKGHFEINWPLEIGYFGKKFPLLPWLPRWPKTANLFKRIYRLIGAWQTRWYLMLKIVICVLMLSNLYYLCFNGKNDSWSWVTQRNVTFGISTILPMATFWNISLWGSWISSSITTLTRRDKLSNLFSERPVHVHLFKLYIRLVLILSKFDTDKIRLW